jgi:hypothetical protein
LVSSIDEVHYMVTYFNLMNSVVATAVSSVQNKLSVYAVESVKLCSLSVDHVRRHVRNTLMYTAVESPDCFRATNWDVTGVSLNQCLNQHRN